MSEKAPLISPATAAGAKTGQTLPYSKGQVFGRLVFVAAAVTLALHGVPQCSYIIADITHRY
jgi:hypothetical protein